MWGTDAVTKTGYYLNNISNVLRIILLLNFGGIYFDSDVISVKSVPHEEQEKMFVGHFFSYTGKTHVVIFLEILGFLQFLGKYQSLNQCKSSKT